jgi:hypothetical protein
MLVCVLNCSLWGRKVRAAFAVVCLVSPSCAHLLQAQRATSDNHRQDLRLSLKSRPEEKDQKVHDGMRDPTGQPVRFRFPVFHRPFKP